MTERTLLAAATRPFRALFQSDAKEGILLIAVAIAAMVVANSTLGHAYHALFDNRLAWTPIPKLDSLHMWINDAVMVVFFFVVGLEVKRELLIGDLSDGKTLRLPVMAAFAGMAVPAAIYLAIVGDDALLRRGWAIPSATDIAFAMGVVGLLGKRIPAAARLFLLTVAIVDDIGAVLIIALFYTSQLKLLWLFASVAAFGALMLLNWYGVNRRRWYIVGTAVLWFCVLHSGVHATIAGVLAAFTIPMRTRDGIPLLENFEHTLVGWNAYLVVPIFGFANAGVDLRGLGLEYLLLPLPLAIAAGLVVGKQVGIFGAVLLAEKLNISPRPGGISWMQTWGIATLCGIGFTMSLFIATLSYFGNDELYNEAKIGVLAGTLVSLILGYVILRFASPNPVVAPAQSAEQTR
jgi:NhaA family Na+:H+ antiporter